MHKPTTTLWCLLLVAASACEPQWPTAQKTALPARCCEERGACVAPDAVDARYVPLLGARECGAPELCAPTNLLTVDRLATCRVSSNGAEGRCLSDCLAAVSDQGDRLARDSCADHERCVPCYDPVSGEPTGACSFGKDSGPVEPPVVLGTCCGALGRCVPGSAIAEEQRKLLGRDACVANELCAPKGAAEQGDAYRPERCTSSIAPGAEGRCLPSCLPALSTQAMLARDDCQDGELCAPCFDPLTGTATGSCDLVADPGPSAPPVVFPSCCGELGHCVPGNLVPATQRAHLDARGCNDAEQLCAPTTLLQGGQPSPCISSLANAEGRCLPACLPELVAQRDRLQRDACAAGELCAPCFDPVTGMDTGSCHLATDPGPREAGATFDSCCAGQGKCVPDSTVPAAERARLGTDTCQQPSQLCAPSMFLQENFVPQRCEVTPLQREGRCLPACLPELAAQAASLSRSHCGPNELCAPCSDPLTGDDTGSCRLGSDQGPAQTETALATCCAGQGRCVPSTALDERARMQLGADSCGASDALCAPELLLRDPSSALASCTVSALGAEGRCVPDCLPAVTAQRAIVTRDDCQEGQSCIPCYDPLRGAPTGACTLGGDDGPTQGPAWLATCCAGLGRCAPAAWVPEEFRALFDDTGCDGAGEQRCVAPQAALEDAASFRPNRCEDPRTRAEGRCLPACLPLVAAQADRLVPASCGAEERCVPCYDPLDGQPTGACTLPADPGPTRPAIIFPSCCRDLRGNDQGVCAPKAIAPANVAAALPADSCSGQDQVCLPRALARDPASPLTKCSSALATEGVCLPSCFLPALTPVGSCQIGQACAPCSQLGPGIAGC